MKGQTSPIQTNASIETNTINFMNQNKNCLPTISRKEKISMNRIAGFESPFSPLVVFSRCIEQLQLQHKQLQQLLPQWPLYA